MKLWSFSSVGSVLHSVAPDIDGGHHEHQRHQTAAPRTYWTQTRESCKNLYLHAVIRWTAKKNEINTISGRKIVSIVSMSSLILAFYNNWLL